MRLLKVSLAALVLFGMMFVGCSTDNPAGPSTDQTMLDKKKVEPATGEGTFTFETKFTYVRSYAGGGGIFLLKITPGADLTGDVAVSVSADRTLAASFTAGVVNSDSPITELVLSPTAKVPLGIHVVTVTASNQTMQQTIELEVEVVPWGPGSMNVARDKHSEFVDWLSDEHPELGNFAAQTWDIYGTYPQIMIVEHHTFLNDEWEFRICFHVMIPPDDWSKMSIRRRGEWEPTLAAMREWDEASQTYIIHEIPVEEYPVIFGY